MKTVLVTGATGFLGGAVARDLHSRGWKVRASGRNEAAGERLRAEGISFAGGDLAVSPAVANALVEGCERVVHCAALASPWGTATAFEASNVRATRHVLAACQNHPVARLVHISSPSVVFDFADQYALQEDAPWNAAPANDYIATKREAEGLVLDACRNVALRACILRPQAIFGSGDPTLVPRILRVARRGFFPRFRREPTVLDLAWIGDVVQAVRLALEGGPQLNGRVYSITSDDPQPLSAILAVLFAAHSLQVREVPLAFERALRLAGMMEWFSRRLTASRWEPPLTLYSVGAITFSKTFDLTAARRDLGYRPSGAVLKRLAAMVP